MRTFGPQPQPLSFLPTFSLLLQGIVENSQDQYDNLKQAEFKPYLLDDRLIERMTNLYREQQEEEDSWIEQLNLWKALNLTVDQRRQIENLTEQAEKLKILNRNILDLVDKIAPHTLTKKLEKDGIELALEYLSDPGASLESLEEEAQDTYKRMNRMAQDYAKLRSTLNVMIPLLLSTLPRLAAERGAKRLNLYEDGNLLAENSHEVFVMLDYCLFHSRENGKNLIVQHLEKRHAILSDEEKAVYGVLKHAFFAVLNVEAIMTAGGIAVYDLLREDYYILFDANFSKTAKPGMLIVCHLIKQPGYVLTTGASIPVRETSPSKQKILNELQKFPMLDTTKQSVEITQLATEVFKICIWDDLALEVE